MLSCTLDYALEVHIMKKLLEVLKDKFKALGDREITDADLEAIASDADVTAAYDAETEESIKEATEGLSKKNVELLKEKKALQLKVKDGTKEDLDDLEKQISDLSEKNEELTRTLTAKEKALKNAETKYGVDTKALNEKLTAERTRADTMLLDKALAEGLGKITIDPAMKNVVSSHLRGMLTLVDENGERKALAKYADDKGKEVQLPFADYVEKVWAPSDEGKAFIRSKASGGARDDTGGKAGKGSGGGSGGSDVNPFEALAFKDGSGQ